MPLKIWTNAKFSDAATRLLREGTSTHQLIQAAVSRASVLDAGGGDAGFAEADIAFGQPDPGDCMSSKRVRWVEVTSAGYTRYETTEFFEALKSRGAAFTNASGVFADPCAQHILAMMLAFGRQLLPTFRDQITDRSWHYDERRAASRLLTGERVLMLGYGAIGRRLRELLNPFGAEIYAFRRKAASESGVRFVTEGELPSVLRRVDHVVNILPANPATDHFVNESFFAACVPGVRFYNVGRGSTVDQPALVRALRAGVLGCAYLDVTEPEPLPREHELWTTPNCFITPHMAGGRHDQDETLVLHFLKNLTAFEKGETMADRVF
jgi:phosphoglycerate dehydrogenase-like enzyme